ncbi:chaplin family protein [Streptomyces xanthochromogenes]|uniref:chaplin family protein n=1 Tax=Streptomyces xanthochromogenes TaxID=67384 RepID=UPI0038078D2E
MLQRYEDKEARHRRTAHCRNRRGGGSHGSTCECGGVGDFLSPAFGTDCANLNTGARAAGSTTRGSGTVGGNLLGLPIGSPLNQCGGADTPGEEVTGILGSASNADIDEITLTMAMADLSFS